MLTQDQVFVHKNSHLFASYGANKFTAVDPVIIENLSKLLELFKELQLPDFESWASESVAKWEGLSATKFGSDGARLMFTWGVFHGFPAHTKHQGETIFVTITRRTKGTGRGFVKIWCDHVGMWHSCIEGETENPVRFGFKRWWVRDGQSIERTGHKMFPDRAMRRFIELFLQNNGN